MSVMRNRLGCNKLLEVAVCFRGLKSSQVNVSRFSQCHSQTKAVAQKANSESRTPTHELISWSQLIHECMTPGLMGSGSGVSNVIVSRSSSLKEITLQSEHISRYISNTLI